MIGLLRKELRQLLPVALLVIITMSINLVYVPFSQRLDEVSWTGTVGDLEPGEGVAGGILLLVLGLVTAYSLFPREHDEHTIEFLYSLPVARWKPFVAKVVSGLIVLIGGIGLGMVVDALLPTFNVQTFSGDQFRLSTALRVFLLLVFYSTMILCHGVFISFFRRFGLVLYGIIWWIIWTLEHGPRPMPWVNHLNIVRWEYFGSTLLIPWVPISIHLSVAFVVLALSYVLWTAPTDGATTWHRRLSERIWGRVILVTGTVLIVGLVFSIAYRMDADHPDTERPPAYFLPFQAARYSTDHYKFTYEANQRTVALPLIQRSDEVYDIVAGHLRAELHPEIVVDLTEDSSEHSGIAGWKKIRMKLHQLPEFNLRVLAHETAHVFQAVESDGKMSDYANSTHFFNEGLAERLAFRAFPDEQRIRHQRLVGAVAWKRLNMTFDEIADLAGFRRLYDENLLYALGELWVDALERVCGDAAPGAAVRALARENAPADLGGSILWQDTLQAIGCELESVNDEWRRQMSDIAVTEDSAAIPRISGGVLERNQEMIVLVAYLDRTITDESPSLRLRVRNSEDEAEENVQEYRGEIREGSEPLEVEFEVPAKYVSGRRFDFQFGYRVDSDVPYYAERWQSADVPRIQPQEGSCAPPAMPFYAPSRE